MAALLESWVEVLRRAGVSDEGAARASGAALAARYAEPHRRHHGTDHLRTVLDHVEGLVPYAEDPDAVRLAAWFHDAVHEGRPDDEERSARLAEQTLTSLGVGPGMVRDVARLVRVTASHDPVEGDRDGAVLSDADLAVLAGDPGEYGAYAAAVREEYRHLDDVGFAAGRREVLERLIARPSLFRTPLGRRAWESRARRNVTTELSLLTAVARPPAGTER